MLACGRSGPASGRMVDPQAPARGGACTAPTPRSRSAPTSTPSPDLAADAINEWIELMVVQVDRQAPPVERGRTLHLHATDAGLGPTGEWTIVNDEDGPSWSHEHGKGDVALRGTAEDLLLAIVRRRDVADGDIEVFGDTDGLGRMARTHAVLSGVFSRL